MHCEDIKEILVSLMYEEEVSIEGREGAHQHLETCLACKNELIELKSMRNLLSMWKDEEPQGNLIFVKAESRPSWSEIFKRIFSVRDLNFIRAGRAVAIAALVIMAFLALSNAEIRWERGKFSFRTGIMKGRNQSPIDAPKSAEIEPVSQTVGRYTDRQLLEMFDSLLADSEQRQLKYMAAMVQQVVSQMEYKQHGELVQIRQDLDSINRKHQKPDENLESKERPKSF